MNNFLLNTQSQEFIDSHLTSDTATLLLKGTSIEGVATNELVEQIESKKRSLKKLPTWFYQEGIYYPNKLNIEQTSSEITAKYKASLLSGSSIIDLTGGFGIDSYYFSKHFESVIHCEINEELSKIVSHNFNQLEVNNIETFALDGLEYLRKSNNNYDWIYVDPSRRHDLKGKVFFLNDCVPKIPDELEHLFGHSKNIMIKTSPLLDVSAGMNELKFVKAIHIVAVDNEVKELLWILEKDFKSEVSIETINIKPASKEIFKFKYADELQLNVNYSAPLTYLYEPNSAILKSGGFNSVASKLNLFKIEKHSHLYTNDNLIDFPGRTFHIQKTIPYQKKAIRKLDIKKANVTTRNFPETVQQIRNKFAISDGGDQYLFFTTDQNNSKIILVCSKIN